MADARRLGAGRRRRWRPRGRAWSPDPRAARAMVAMALMAQISLLVAAMRGSDWQVDMHMYYFAVLALVGFYCDAAR